MISCPSQLHSLQAYESTHSPCCPPKLREEPQWGSLWWGDSGGPGWGEQALHVQVAAHACNGSSLSFPINPTYHSVTHSRGWSSSFENLRSSDENPCVLLKGVYKWSCLDFDLCSCSRSCTWTWVLKPAFLCRSRSQPESCVWGSIHHCAGGTDTGLRFYVDLRMFTNSLNKCVATLFFFYF